MKSQYLEIKFKNKILILFFRNIFIKLQTKIDLNKIQFLNYLMNFKDKNVN
jgi:hypothetical protein